MAYLSDRIEQIIRKRFGGNGRALARAASIPEASLPSYRSGRSKPGHDAIVRICKATDVRADWLLFGQGPMFNGETDEGKPSNEVRIPWMDVQASAADGAVLGEVEKASWRFNADFFRRWIGLPPERCVLLETCGDSMEPTLQANQPVVVYVDKSQALTDGLWLVRIGSFLFVKRLQVLLGGTLSIVSDNPAYAEQKVTLTAESPDFAVIGRVVWSLRTH